MTNRTLPKIVVTWCAAVVAEVLGDVLEEAAVVAHRDLEPIDPDRARLRDEPLTPQLGGRYVDHARRRRAGVADLDQASVAALQTDQISRLIGIGAACRRRTA